MSKTLQNDDYGTVLKWLSDMGNDQAVNTSLNIENQTKLLDIKEESNFTKIIAQTNNIAGLENIFNDFSYFNKLKINKEYKIYDGTINADLMVVGDQPSKEDLEIGLPFQGEIGSLLDAMLQAIKFDRKNTFYTNLFHNEGVFDHNINFFISMLYKQIELVSPKIIIMFGAEVTKAISEEKQGIFASRGKWYNIKSNFTGTNFSAISMFHPRHLLLKPENKKEAWVDLKEIRKKFSN